MIAGFNGAKEIESETTFENLMVWATVEHLAQNLTKKQQIEVDETAEKE